MGRYLTRLARRLPPPLSWILAIAAKSPLGIVFAAIIGGGWYYNEGQLREGMSWHGVPEAQQPYEWKTFFRILRNDGFLIGWSDIRLTPLWVEYQLTTSKSRYHLKRLEGFSQDWRSGLPLKSSAYDRSGYDRGHMAPNYAISSVYGPEGQRDTFLMTNVAPQRPNLNRKAWQRLESAVMDHMLPRFGTLWVITGPIYKGIPQWLPSCRLSIRHLSSLPTCVSIPQAFFKIIVAPNQHGQPPKVIAFVMPQQVTGREPLDHFLVPVGEIEKRTGLKFFSQLPEQQQARLKNTVDVSGWGLSGYSRIPARY